MSLLDAAHEADFRAHLLEFEGRTDYLYADSDGNPTIGVGCMIPSAAACEGLAWGRPGAAMAWVTIKAAKPGMAATAYALLTTMRLPAAEVDRLLDERIAGTERELVKLVQGISDMPMPVRQAILDMAFNMGAGKLHQEFFGPGCKFGPAIYRGDWQEAAGESARRGVRMTRNNYTRDLLCGGLEGW